MFRRGLFDKRGVSAVVATVLIIMITVAAVGIVWAIVIPMIRDNLGGSVVCNDADVSIGTTQGYTCYDVAQQVVAVQAVKGANKVTVSSLKFTVSSGGNSVSYSTDYDFISSASKVFYIKVSELNSVEEIGLIPILTDGKSTKECGKVVLNNIPNCKLPEVETINDIFTSQFSSYSDNSFNLLDSGTGEFSVTVDNTNGTVYLEINGTSVLANNISNVYTVSTTISSAGIYSYKWYSWGNGTQKKYSVSDNRNYVVNSSFSGGDGSPGNPYQISSWTELNRVRNYLDKSFVLTKDLTSGDGDYLGIGNNFSSIGYCGLYGDGCSRASCLSLDGTEKPFIGNFNGSNFVISNLIVKGYSVGTGLFGYSIGSISNVILTSVGASGAGHCNSAGSFVGGLVGFNEGSIGNSEVSGLVTGAPLGYQSYLTGDYIGGLVGHNRGGSISNSHSSAEVYGNNNVGGLIGENDGTISNSYSIGNVFGKNNVGGLVGYSAGLISNSYSTGIVTGMDSVGGLVGDSLGAITDSYATGKVYGGSSLGGLVGSNGGSISRTFANGSVIEVSISQYHGGLVGDNYGSIVDSYSTGDLSGSNQVGGLVGENSVGSISNSYSTGSVPLDGTEMGGLIGRPGGSVSSSFFNNETSGQTYLCGVAYSGDWECESILGNTAAEMKTQNIFESAGWDFTDTWKINEGVDYPKLMWQS